MNVNGNVSFKGVAPEVMQNFETIKRKMKIVQFRQSLSKLTFYARKLLKMLLMIK